jgi:undecaprenyl diphosphate synthase
MTVLDRIRLGRRLRAHTKEPQLPRTATSVAIIMDGNARWARRHGQTVAAGHRAGTAALRRTVEAAPTLGVRSLCVYAFSTENWSRPDNEVADLLDLFADTIRNEFPDLDRQGVRIRFVGRRDRVSDTLRGLMNDIEHQTAANDRLDLFVAFDYGGRAEIVEACRRVVQDGLPASAVTAEAIHDRLARPELPDPDLVIRTSGEMRLSNFLLWQTAYAELVFSPVYWPDFGYQPLRDALVEYASRRRRFGGR